MEPEESKLGDFTGLLDDPIYYPKHYQVFPDRGAMSMIEELLTPEELKGYLKGSILKYRFRAGLKDDTEQDIKKAMWFQRRLFEDAR